MYSEYNTPHKRYQLKTDKFICNKFGLAEFFSKHYGEFESVEGIHALDVGCGALPIGIFLADQFHCKITGIELNSIACKCAEYNVQAYHLRSQIDIINENFATFADQSDLKKLDLIVSNPPVDDNVSIEDIKKYAESNYDNMNDDSFSYLTNSWHSIDGKDLIDYIFLYGRKSLKPDGKIILVFCNIDCTSPEYIYKKAEDYDYKIIKEVDGFISTESIGAESLGINKVYASMVQFGRK